MYGSRKFFNLPGLFSAIYAVVVLLSVPADAQKLLAVLNLENDGTLPEKYNIMVADKISELIAGDSGFVQFERSMLPELLQQLSVEQSAATCSNEQCLSLIGSLIGANRIIGGTIGQTKKSVEITLNFIDVDNRKLVNFVNISSGSAMEVIISRELEPLTRQLLYPDGTPSVAKKKENKGMRRILRSPVTYITLGTLFLAGAAGGGAYYYKNYYKNDSADKPVPDDDPIVEEPPKEIPVDDIPHRTRGE